MNIVTVTMNLSLKELHEALVKEHASLACKLGIETSLDVAKAILREMQEFSFRMSMCGNLLFKQTTERIDSDIGGVIAATANLDAAIKQADQITNLIKASSSFLGLVDKVLDKVKLL